MRSVVNLLALRYFQVVARHENVSRAAEELFVAQPSVSRTIARLESDLGAPLFDRDGRQVRLNRFGAAFLARVDRALAELDDGRRELLEATGLPRGSVAVTAETLLTLSEILPIFRAEQPDVDLRLHQGGPDLMRDQLVRGEVDFALASQPLEAPDLASATILDERVLLAVPTGHRLAGAGAVGIEDLAGEPLVATRRGGWQRALIDRLFARHDLVPQIVCESDEPAATEYLVGSGLGVSLVPQMSSRHTSSTVVWVDVADPRARRELTLVWRRGGFLSAAAVRFRELALEVGRRMADDDRVRAGAAGAGDPSPLTVERGERS